MCIQARIPSGRRRWIGLLACLATVSVAGCDPASDELLLVGTVERTTIEVVAPVSERIVRLDAVRGRRVESGQELAELDKTMVLAELARAEANLASARTGELVAKQDRDRTRTLRGRNVASEQELDRARLAYDEAAARLRESEAMVEAARKRVEDLVLESPVDGLVDQVPFDVGERVPAGAVLVVVRADERPWVRVWLPETSYVRVDIGTPAEIHIDGYAETLEGRVIDISSESAFTPHYALTERDRVHLVFETRVEILGAPETLRPGIPAEVRIQAPEHVLVSGP